MGLGKIRSYDRKKRVPQYARAHRHGWYRYFRLHRVRRPVL